MTFFQKRISRHLSHLFQIVKSFYRYPTQKTLTCTLSFLATAQRTVIGTCSTSCKLCFLSHHVHRSEKEKSILEAEDVVLHGNIEETLKPS